MNFDHPRLLIGLTATPCPDITDLPDLSLVPAGALTGLTLPLDITWVGAAPPMEFLVRIHDSLQSVSSRCPLIPVRYGHILRTPTQLETELEPDLPRWLRLLGRIGEASELSLIFRLPRVDAREPTPSPEGKGRAFLESRRGHHGIQTPSDQRPIESLHQRLIECAGDVVLDSVVHSHSITDDLAVIEVTVLVSRKDMAVARSRLQAFPVSHELKGPFLPFSFATL
jgi:hypothetical protein